MEILFNLFSKIPNWLRWILIFPISIVTYFISNIVVNVIGKILGFVIRDPIFNDNIFTHFISPAVAGYLCLVLGVAISPSKQPLISFILVCLWLFIFGVLLFFAFVEHKWYDSIAVFISSIALIYAYIQLKNEIE
jgi:hypothetical protein